MALSESSTIICHICEEENVAIYVCEKCDLKDKKPYCERCGEIRHTKKDHKFQDHYIMVCTSKLQKEKVDSWNRLAIMKAEELVKSIKIYVSDDSKMIPKATCMTMLSITAIKLCYEHEIVQSLISVSSHVSKSQLSWGSAAVIGTWELSLMGYQLYAGVISWSEFGRRFIRCVLSKGIGAMACYGGAMIGAEIGTAICPGAGTLLGGLIGLIVGAAASAGTEQLFERVWPQDIKLDELKQDALKMFGVKDIYNEKVFNKENMKRKYKAFCLAHHPDKNNGDDSDFKRLQTNWGIIVGLLKVVADKNNQTFDIQQTIINSCLAIECY